MQPQALPITHIRAVVGETPANVREVPLWFARALPALQGVYPAPDAATRARIVNALTVRHPGLAIRDYEAASWQEVVATLWTRCHGHTALSALGQLVEDVSRTDGIIMATNLALMMSGDNWELVWGMVRRYLPSQASVIGVQNRLDELPNDEARIVMFDQIVQEVFGILGLDPLGRPQPTQRRERQQPQPSRAPQRRNQNRRQQNQQSEGNGRRSSWNRGNYPNRNSGQIPPPRRDSRPADQNRNQNQEERRTYNFRDQPRQPDRFGFGNGGYNPYRQSQNNQSRPEDRPRDGNRNQRPSDGNNGQRNRQERRTVNTVQNVPNTSTNTPATNTSPNNGSSSGN